jgi:ppGpp synthetase/RelA/SpoT-type nucleotidyltranferase
VKQHKTFRVIGLAVLGGSLLWLGAKTTASALAETAKKDTAVSIPAKDAKISQGIEARLKGATIRQSVNNLDELYKQAEEADKGLRAFTTNMAKQTHGEAVLVSLKSRTRAEEKAVADYDGDAARVLDISRATIIFDTLDDLYTALAKIDGSPNVKIVRIKDRFSNPGIDGYRDILLNLKMPDGFITELQLQLRQIFSAVKNGGHKIYLEIQAIDRRVKVEKRDFTAEELEQKDRLLEKSRALYNEAFETALKKKQ